MTRLKRPLTLSGILLSALLCASQTALAAETEVQNNHNRENRPYTLASVEGDYGIVGTYAGGIAGLLGVSKTDREGNVEGSAVVNIPGANDTRQIVPITWTGTETVNEDGGGNSRIVGHSSKFQAASDDGHRHHEGGRDRWREKSNRAADDAAPAERTNGTVRYGCTDTKT